MLADAAAVVTKATLANEKKIRKSEHSFVAPVWISMNEYSFETFCLNREQWTHSIFISFFSFLFLLACVLWRLQWYYRPETNKKMCTKNRRRKPKMKSEEKSIVKRLSARCPELYVSRIAISVFFRLLFRLYRMSSLSFLVCQISFDDLSIKQKEENGSPFVASSTKRWRWRQDRIMSWNSFSFRFFFSLSFSVFFAIYFFRWSRCSHFSYCYYYFYVLTFSQKTAFRAALGCGERCWERTKRKAMRQQSNSGLKTKTMSA